MNNRNSMKVILAAGALALASVASVSAPAEARNGRNTAAVVGAIGGLAAGAAIAGSMQQPAYGHYGARQQVIVQDPGEVCEVRTRRVYDQYGRVRTRRTTVCN